MCLFKLALLFAASAGVLSAPLAARDTIPCYAIDYAPVVWIMSQDYYFPGPISSQLLHTYPEVNFTRLAGVPSPLTLDNLNDLNALGGTNVSLSSTEDLTKFPAWFNGTKPDSTGKTSGDPSTAFIVADKGNGTVDVFYMYFYPFNEGNKVFGTDAGNHVGDWEHSAIRFLNGVPQSVWFSQHASGEAFTYGAVEKQGIRPVVYSAKGTHANYATAGEHDHTIPNLNLPFELFLTDVCDRGTLWDPALNAYVYAYDVAADSFAAYDGADPTAWLTYRGTWGDAQLPKTDPRQHYFLGIELTAEWTGGPTGPDDKDLGRAKICPDGDECVVKSVIGP